MALKAERDAAVVGDPHFDAPTVQISWLEGRLVRHRVAATGIHFRLECLAALRPSRDL
jgi:hypothetical protein